MCYSPLWAFFSFVCHLTQCSILLFTYTNSLFSSFLFLVLSRFSSQVSLRISIFVHSSVPAIPGLPIFLCNAALPLDIHPPPFWFLSLSLHVLRFISVCHILAPCYFHTSPSFLAHIRALLFQYWCPKSSKFVTVSFMLLLYICLPLPCP